MTVETLCSTGTSPLLNEADHAQVFIAIAQLLQQYGDIWRPSPFVIDNLPWQQQWPELHQGLLSLTDQQLQDFDDELQLCQWAETFLPQLKHINQWQIPGFNGAIVPMDKFTDMGIPGRKKQQIERFVAAIERPPQGFSGPLLDWCAGKGFLARQLTQRFGQSVVCLEYDAKLCASGRQVAVQQQLAIQFVQQDVLQPIPEQWLNAQCHTALHACGDLHVSMIKQACRAQSRHIVLSPCCYHLIQDPVYQPLSELAKSTPLLLSKSDLRLAVLQSVTAGARVRRLRTQELLWRIGYDLLQRQLTGNDHYQPCPSVNKTWLSGQFSDFCHWLAKAQGLLISAEPDYLALLAAAKVKLDRVIRLEKARLIFRRALEYYLVLDRTLLMAQFGYQVRLCQFCPTADSPRNILIQGQLYPTARSL